MTTYLLVAANSSSSSDLQKPERVFLTTGAVLADDPLTIANGTFDTAGAQTTITSYGTPVLPGSGAAFKADSRIMIFKNGQNLVLGSSAGDKQDVYWISATQIAFSEAFAASETIKIITPIAI